MGVSRLSKLVKLPLAQIQRKDTRLGHINRCCAISIHHDAGVCPSRFRKYHQQLPDVVRGRVLGQLQRR